MSQMLPPLHALRAFEAVARLGSLAAAADDLCITHSAVSHQVSNLEEWMKVALLERVGKSLRLTPAGKAYAQTVCIAFHSIRTETAFIRSKRDDLSVRVSCLPMIAVSWLLPKLHDFWGAHPEIEVSLNYSRASTDIDFESIDIAIQFGKPTDFPGFDTVPFLQGQAIAVCSPRYRESHRLSSVKDLLRCHLIHDEDTSYWKAWFHSVGLSLDDVRSSTLFPDGNLALASAMAGDGVALLRSAAIQDQLRSCSLIQVFPESIDSDKFYLITIPSDCSSRPSVSLFKDWALQMASRAGFIAL